ALRSYIAPFPTRRSSDLDLPPEIAEVGGSACLVEQEATGNQVTVEGYSHDDGIEIYGVIDSITHPDAPSFLRYEYPSPRKLGASDRKSTRLNSSHVKISY